MSDPTPELTHTIAALRARGAHHADPVRFSFIEALARRTACQGGAARRLLDQRLAEVVAAFVRQHGHAGPGVAQDPLSMARVATAASAAVPPGPLAALVARLHGAGGSAPGSELKAVRTFGRTWARLSADRQITQSRASLPAQTGPLNSHRLVLQALQQMQALSPDYLQRFIAHVDGLRALALAEAGPERLPPDQVAAPLRRKARRAKG